MNKASQGCFVALTAAAVLHGLHADAQVVYRHTDEKGKITYSDRPHDKAVNAVPPQAATAPAAPAPAAPRPQGSGTRYEPTGPVIDFNGRYSEPPASTFKTNGSYARPYYHEKSIDQRVAEQHRMAEEAKKRQDMAKERAIEQDRQRVEREARLRLEADKRRLRELQRENDRR